MKDLISHEALIDDIDAAMRNSGMGYVVGQTLKRYVKRQPVVDAVEAVYAEDYKHSFEMIAEKYAKIQDEMLKGELVEVVHGRWLSPKTPKGSAVILCSGCGKTADWGYNYCPNCGARMDGE